MQIFFQTHYAVFVKEKFCSHPSTDIIVLQGNGLNSLPGFNKIVLSSQVYLWFCIFRVREASGEVRWRLLDVALVDGAHALGVRRG